MRELVEDKIYEILNNKYDELLLDYVLLSFDEEISVGICINRDF